jgi:hypothetical protein
VVGHSTRVILVQGKGGFSNQTVRFGRKVFDAMGQNRRAAAR